MHSEYEASVLSREKATAGAGQSDDLSRIMRRIAIWMAGVAVLTLVGLDLSARTSSNVAHISITADSPNRVPASPRVSETVNGLRPDGDIDPEFQFGYVEFDQNPGSVWGFGPIPQDMRAFASIPTFP